jgi:hypothetical protein
VNHRHLLPDEIDLLLDEEVGFGVNPLKAHVRECPDCRARVEEARIVVDALEDLPHLAPAHTFATRVMTEVPVFVPWYVSARDSIRQFVPQSRTARVAVLALATSAASVLTIALLWVASQTDALVVASGLVGDRARDLVLQVGRDVIATVFGEQLFAIVQRTGTIGVALALVAFFAAAGGTMAGLGALAAASSRRRG